MPPLLLYARVKLSWGFTVRYPGTSAAQPAFLIPPPTTVVGAFAQPLARLLGLGDSGVPAKYGEGRALGYMPTFLEATLAASAALPRLEGVTTGLAVHLEPSRIIALPYKGEAEVNRFMTEEDVDAVPRAMPVQAVGASYGPGALLELAWVLDVDSLARRLNVSPSGLEAAARKAVWGLTRLGSKEGIAAVLDAWADAATEVTGSLATRFYIPLDCVEGEADNAAEVVLTGLKYGVAAHLAPRGASQGSYLVPSKLPMRFKLAPRCRGYQSRDVVLAGGP